MAYFTEHTYFFFIINIFSSNRFKTKSSWSIVYNILYRAYLLFLCYKYIRLKQLQNWKQLINGLLWHTLQSILTFVFNWKYIKLKQLQNWKKLISLTMAYLIEHTVLFLNISGSNSFKTEGCRSIDYTTYLTEHNFQKKKYNYIWRRVWTLLL